MPSRKYRYDDLLRILEEGFEGPIEDTEGFLELPAEHYLDETQAIYHERHKKLPEGELIDRYIETHDHHERWKNLWKYYVEPHQNVSQEKKHELALP